MSWKDDRERRILLILFWCGIVAFFAIVVFIMQKSLQ